MGNKIENVLNILKDIIKIKTSEDCTLCPKIHINCEDEDKFTSFIGGKHGINQCKEQYSENCEGESCQIEKG